ncbi:putative ribonuclease H-like domain-containing protein [Tanacetum coccineum]
MNQFYEMKGILRQFSVPRTPQQNRVVERRNRTLIEAARTMLADSKLPTTFWAEAINTACYVQNRMLVVKPHNKTPYELFHGRTSTLSFMRPFGCHVTILNTIDHLGKFDGKAYEGFFVRYSLNSKAFRVFNSRIRIVEENLHIRFSKSTPNVAGSRPDWLFDIDALTRSMNYEPIVADPKSSHDDGSKPSSDDGKKVDEDPRKNINGVGGKTSIKLLDDPNMPALEDYSIFDFTRDNEDDDAKTDINNLDITIQVSPNPTIRIHKNHPFNKVIGDLQSATQTRRMSKNLEEHGFVSTVQQRTNHKDLLKCLFACFLSQEEHKKLAMKQISDGNSTTEAEYVAALSCCGQLYLILLEKEKKSVRLMMEKLLIRENKQRVLVRKRIERIDENKNRKRLVWNKNRQSDLVSKRIERSGINLLLLLKVNAARHNLLLLESKGFEQIVDFLNANPIRYALTINPTIYISCIEQFWSTVKAKTVNGEVQLHALVDGKKIIIIESTVRRDLQLEDAEGVDCLPNSTIFEQLTLMGSKTTAWNEFSSTMAPAIIYLATNQKFNFSKYIFESMVKNLDNVGKFFMYPGFIQVFLDKQLEGMPTHNRIYITPSHTKKIFGNMRRARKGFSGRETPLFQTIVVQDQAEMGEGSANPTDPHHTPTFIQPLTSQPQKKQKPKKPKRKDTQIP